MSPKWQQTEDKIIDHIDATTVPVHQIRVWRKKEANDSDDLD